MSLHIYMPSHLQTHVCTDMFSLHMHRTTLNIFHLHLHRTWRHLIRLHTYGTWRQGTTWELDSCSIGTHATMKGHVRTKWTRGILRNCHYTDTFLPSQPNSKYSRDQWQIWALTRGFFCDLISSSAHLPVHNCTPAIGTWPLDNQGGLHNTSSCAAHARWVAVLWPAACKVVYNVVCMVMYTMMCSPCTGGASGGGGGGGRMAPFHRHGTSSSSNHLGLNRDTLWSQPELYSPAAKLWHCENLNP